MKFEPISGNQALDEQISGAYKEKYKASFYLPPMIVEGPVSATVKIVLK